MVGYVLNVVFPQQIARLALKLLAMKRSQTMSAYALMDIMITQLHAIHATHFALFARAVIRIVANAPIQKEMDMQL